MLGALNVLDNEQNQQLLKAIYDLRQDKRELINNLIECYKIK